MPLRVPVSFPIVISSRARSSLKGYRHGDLFHAQIDKAGLEIGTLPDCRPPSAPPLGAANHGDLLGSGNTKFDVFAVDCRDANANVATDHDFLGSSPTEDQHRVPLCEVQLQIRMFGCSF